VSPPPESTHVAEIPIIPPSGCFHRA
jgi:hypothetical protein